MRTTKKINICGIKFDNVSNDELLEEITSRLTGERSNCFIVTPNVDFIVKASKDYKFGKIINEADLSLCDSSIIRLASHFLNKNIKERITGYDVLDTVCKAGIKKHKYFILGGKQGIAEKAALNLQKRYSNVEIAGYYHGYFTGDQEEAVLNLINSSHTDVLVVGMGVPRQEQWVAKSRNMLKTKIIVCIGGIVDLLAGSSTRAPRWMQNMYIEWLWRLIKEPRRLGKRYLIDDMQFFYLVYKEKRGQG